ncbi:hypothetical protein L596_020705 [Steinernema carpocapsae]|uniref:G-protein coupled receptors family 1 profile domain-containing protein n=1 Tax=Steinernema carpocapsae TaxID=34508 RepID=A0A4U5MV00_STECR|nr:hypothetical protein L596_020705 [Steinernema carpocapsae]
MENAALVSGIIYIGLGVTPIPIYFRMLWVLLTKKEFRRNECFFLMSQVGICDLLMICGQPIFGFTILTSHGLFGFTEYAAVPVFASSWVAMLAMSFVLSVNRLKVICDLQLPSYTVTVLLVIAWVFGFFFFFSYVTRLSPMVIVDGLALFYDTKVSYAMVIQKIEFYASMILIAISLAIYVYIIFCLLVQRCQSSVNTLSIHSGELKLFILALVEFFSCACLDMAWHFGDYFLPASEWTGTAVNALIIFHCGWINPGLSLLLSEKLRRAVFSHSKKNLVATRSQLSTQAKDSRNRRRSS